MTSIERLRRSGIRRLGTPASGFRYVHADGGPVSAADLERVRALVLPPAWRDVAISASATARLQAVGRDAAGRWQYRYSASQVRARDRTKLERLLRFAEALPRLRRRVARDLALRGLAKERVLAAIVRILDRRHLRPGSQEYADAHGSIGLATLRPEHVTVEGDVVRFDFPGKSRKRHETDVRDAAVARVVRECLATPGRDVFKFVGRTGRVVDVRRRHVNAYVAAAAGTRASAKDFRTWAGTLVCAQTLARAVVAQERELGDAARRRLLARAVREAAEALGNTPAVCRRAYIAPPLLDAFARGALADPRLAGARRRAALRLTRAERALLEVLRGPEGAAGVRRRRRGSAGRAGARSPRPGRRPRAGARRRTASRRVPRAPASG